MQKTNLLLIFLFPLLFNCTPSKKQTSFEGTLTYKITVTPHTNDEDFNERQIQKYGKLSKVQITKNGSLRREFMVSGPKGFDYLLYNAATGKGYTKYRNMDTIIESNSNENSLHFVSEKDLPAKIIHGESCKGYSILCNEPRSNQSILLTYYYPSNKEYLNPEFYKLYKDGFYDKAMQKMQAPFYQLMMEMPTHTVIFEIENIEPGTVKDEVLTIPSDIPMVGL